MPAVRGNQRSDDLGVASGRGARFEGGGGAISAGTRFAPRLSQEKPERSPLAPRATTAGASERTGQDGSESAPAVIAHAAETPALRRGISRLARPRHTQAVGNSLCHPPSHSPHTFSHHVR